MNHLTPHLDSHWVLHIKTISNETLNYIAQYAGIGVKLVEHKGEISEIGKFAKNLKNFLTTTKN